MKSLYSRLISVIITLFFLISYSQVSIAQCASGTGGTTAYDTTIVTPSGINTLQIKFPKFNPHDGMVTCVKLCVNITGVIDSLSIENNSASPQTADVYYIRTDQITGPGLVSPLTNSINYHYPSFALGATNGIPGSGPDFVSIVHDTILNATQVCRQLTDSATIVQFYGTDSVTYTYDITAFTNISCTGGNYNSSIATSAFVRFRFEYCTCPPFVLPLTIRNFDVTKLTADKAELKWSGFDDPSSDYHYEAQMSRDGHSFITIGSVPVNTTNTSDYRFVYRAFEGQNGAYYFRIKQVYANGNSRYSNTRQVTLGNPGFPAFTLYPNPSDGIVGIKFVDNSTGHFNIQIYNTQGQTMVKKDIVMNGSSYAQVAVMESGVYWVRLTDMKTQKSSVNQLLIK